MSSKLRRIAAKLPGAREASGDARHPLALLTRSHYVPKGDDWLHEVKRDGYRMTVVVRASVVRCFSRHDLEWTERLPAVVNAVTRLGLKDAQLDGEAIAVADGKDDFNLLQRTLDGEVRAPLAYVAFDLLRLERVDLTKTPLLARKELLADVVRGTDVVYSSHLVGEGQAAFDAVSLAGHEGIVSKRVDSTYPTGRTHSWLKILARLQDDFVVVGWMEPQGESHGGLMVARLIDGQLEYAGRVGAGIRNVDRIALEAALRLVTKAPLPETEHLAARRKRITWYAPTVIVRIAFRGLGRDGLLRLPSFKGIRRDA